MSHTGRGTILLGRVALLTALAMAERVEAEAPRAIILATTTSTQDSGLLDALLPLFEAGSGYQVKTISVGSGQAIAMGRRGDADVLLVHSPADERKLMDDGYGRNRRLVMHNDFVVLGPPEDPARIKGTSTAREALARVAEQRSPFYSRGDGSGTHAKEKGLWKAAGIDPSGQSWYRETGLGMGETLNVAAEKGGYTLSDRGTFLARNRASPLHLVILTQGEPQYERA